MKQSGFGRELGPAGLAEYQEAKHIWRNTRARARRGGSNDRRLDRPAEPDPPGPPRPRAPAADRTDDDDSLAEFGYKPELKRTLGNFHTFAAGISYISILTGTFQLFYFGVAFGGPAYWWSWPMVFVGQLMVALCFCELAARYPVAGSVYNWAKKHGQSAHRLARRLDDADRLHRVARGRGARLPARRCRRSPTWFQFVGDGTGEYDAATNARPPGRGPDPLHHRWSTPSASS